MAPNPNVYQKEGIGWFIRLSDREEGPLESNEEAQRYLKLLLLTCAARTEVACLERECLV
ncbi:MAG: hypothetical protein OEY52_16165 [Gammaproteobacteria bacterium]|nr:hypothetical protein [Gammaproteobacteria bacterium]